MARWVYLNRASLSSNFASGPDLMAYGLFTRNGSGINKHPMGDSQDPVVGYETKRT